MKTTHLLLGGSPAAAKQMFPKQTPLLRTGRASLVTLFSHTGTSTTPRLCARADTGVPPPTFFSLSLTSSVLRCPPRPPDGSENGVMSNHYRNVSSRRRTTSQNGATLSDVTAFEANSASKMLRTQLLLSFEMLKLLFI